MVVGCETGYPKFKRFTFAVVHAPAAQVVSALIVAAAATGSNVFTAWRFDRRETASRNAATNGDNFPNAWRKPVANTIATAATAIAQNRSDQRLPVDGMTKETSSLGRADRLPAR